MNPVLDDIGKLILRVTLGLLVLLHGSTSSSMESMASSA